MCQPNCPAETSKFYCRSEVKTFGENMVSITAVILKSSWCIISINAMVKNVQTSSPVLQCCLDYILKIHCVYMIQYFDSCLESFCLKLFRDARLNLQGNILTWVRTPTCENTFKQGECKQTCVLNLEFPSSICVIFMIFSWLTFAVWTINHTLCKLLSWKDHQLEFMNFLLIQFALEI